MIPFRSARRAVVFPQVEPRRFQPKVSATANAADPGEYGNGETARCR